MAPTLAPSMRPFDPMGTLLAGRYRLVTRIGKGGMGSVYCAIEEPSGHRVAVKFLETEDVGDRQRRKRFEREATLLARVQHPNIVSIFDFGTVEAVGLRHPFIVMELAEGRTLAEQIDDEGPLPWRVVAQLGRAIAEGLDHAHRLGILHRDLKPDNVVRLRDRDGEARVKIIDFGLGIAVDDDEERTGLTGLHQRVGSPGYMSPEHIRGEPLDGRADVYALGLLLWVCVTGSHPFERRTAVATLQAHLKEKLPALGRPDVPPDLEALLRRCCAKHPEQRPADAGEVARALGEILAGRRSEPPPSPKPPARRFGPMLAAVTLVALVMMAAVIVWRSGALPG